MSSFDTVTQVTPRRKLHDSRILTTALAAGLAFTCVGPMSPSSALPSASASDQHVKNGTFSSNIDGWRTNSSDQLLTRVAGGHDGAGAALSVKSGSGNVVLNDEKPTVTNAAAGETYTVEAWVKAANPGIGGHLRVRAVTSQKTEVHQQYFHLTSTNWTKVSFTFTNSNAGAKHDLNVLGYDVASNNALMIDDVSLVSTSEVNAISPTPEVLEPPQADDKPTSDIAGQLNNGGTYSKVGIPSNGAYFGAAVGSNSDPAAFEQEAGSKLGIRRTFYQATQVNKAVNNAKDDLANNRLPWISFKLPHSWKDMAAGKGDAWAKDLAEKLDSLNGPVWVAFHHEPEGDQPIEDWVAMQKQLSPIVKNNSDNVAFTTILTGWHQLYGDSKYSLENTWPGDGLVDIIGFDVYNSHDVVKNGKTMKATDMDGGYFTHFEAFAKKHKVDWGIAETGINDSAAKKDPEWMQRTYDQLVSRGGVAMTYFNTQLNSITSWSISDSLKTRQFGEVLEDSTKIK